MQAENWQLKTALDAIVFDCDGTLSAIEGIDVLADAQGVGAEVKVLTEQAMSKDGITLDLYQKRMELVRPTHKQLMHLGDQYFTTRCQDIDAVLAIFKRLNKTLFIISAGLNPSVKVFAKQLELPESCVYAVDVMFDQQGAYRDFDRHALTADRHGKPRIIEQLKKTYPHILHVGDGMNDLEAQPVVDRFVGYGGISYRQYIADLCEFYIKSASMTPLLPLALTAAEVQQLTTEEKHFYDKGQQYIHDAAVIFNQGVMHDR